MLESVFVSELLDVLLLLELAVLLGLLAVLLALLAFPDVLPLFELSVISEAPRLPSGVSSEPFEEFALSESDAADEDEGFCVSEMFLSLSLSLPQAVMPKASNSTTVKAISFFMFVYLPFLFAYNYLGEIERYLVLKILKFMSNFNSAEGKTKMQFGFFTLYHTWRVKSIDNVKIEKIFN